jgi:fatty-acyl-CoA synthase
MPPDLTDALAAAVRRHPRRIAVASDGDRVRYRDLVVAARDYAETLQRNVRPGDRVAIVLPNGVASIVAFFGVVTAGQVACPVDPRMGPGELAKLLSSLAPGAVIGPERHEPMQSRTIQPSELARMCSSLGVQVLPPPRVSPRGAALSRRYARPKAPTVTSTTRASQPAAIFHTSGTSGRPMAVAHSHESLLASVVSLKDMKKTYFALSLENFTRLAKALMVYRGRLLRPVLGSEVWCTPLGSWSIAGFSLALQALLTGQTLVTTRRFDARALLKLVEEERVSHLAMTPTMAVLCLKVRDLATFDLSSLLVLGLGGTSTSPALAKELRTKFGCPVAIGYGSTELGGGVLATNMFDPYEQQLGTVGRTFPGAHIRVSTEDGHDAVPGQVGELLCRTAGLTLGYVEAGVIRAASDQAGWYHTGDLATIDDEGYVRVLGRASEVIVRGGQKVHPTEVEGVLESYPGITGAAVVGVAANEMGDRIMAYMTADAPVNLRAVRAFCRTKLASHKIPHKMHIVDELPTTADGKIQRMGLREAVLKGERIPAEGREPSHV